MNNVSNIVTVRGGIEFNFFFFSPFFSSFFSLGYFIRKAAVAEVELWTGECRGVGWEGRGVGGARPGYRPGHRFISGRLKNHRPENNC